MVAMAVTSRIRSGKLPQLRRPGPALRLRSAVTLALQQGRQAEHGGIGVDDDGRRDGLKIALEATLALEAQTELRTGGKFGKPWHDAATDIDPTAGAAGQGEVAGNDAKEGAEHLEGGLGRGALPRKRRVGDLGGAQ